jgi:hypothetical protein
MIFHPPLQAAAIQIITHHSTISKDSGKTLKIFRIKLKRISDGFFLTIQISFLSMLSIYITVGLLFSMKKSYEEIEFFMIL